MEFLCLVLAITMRCHLESWHSRQRVDKFFTIFLLSAVIKVKGSHHPRISQERWNFFLSENNEREKQKRCNFLFKPRHELDRCQHCRSLAARALHYKTQPTNNQKSKKKPIKIQIACSTMIYSKLVQAQAYHATKHTTDWLNKKNTVL